MENLKFKALSLGNLITEANTWIFGTPVIPKSYLDSDKIQIHNSDTDQFTSCSAKSLAQFSGFVDKNETEIYHKDKFKALSGDVYVVDFHKGAFGYYTEPDSQFRKFVSFAENFANLKGRGNKLCSVEIVTI